MRRRSWDEISWLSGWSCWYDSTANAVRTAENRPAYTEVSASSYIAEETYEYEQVVNVLHVTLHRCLILLHHLTLDYSPWIKGPLMTIRKALR